MDLYPYIKGQDDLVAIVESECKARLKRDIPALFIEKMLNARRITILRAMQNHQRIKLDRLGKLVITNSTKDCLSIREYLGENLTHEAFTKELNNRYIRGDLYSQRFTKLTGTAKKNPYGQLKRFTVCTSKDTEYGYDIDSI